MLNTRILAFGSLLMMRRIASRPLMPGSDRSITTTSGLRSVNSLLACSPLDASAMISVFSDCLSSIW